MFKNVLKFAVGGIIIALLGFLALLGVEYWQYRTSDEYRALKELENLKKQYAEDPYGGDTPEETFRLFIDALKKGDMDLAAKYFVMEKQEEWREDLAKIKERGLLDNAIKDLERLTIKYPFAGADGKRFIFEFETKDPDELTIQVDIIKGASGKWKILDL